MTNSQTNPTKRKTDLRKPTQSEANIDLLNAAPKAEWETPSNPDNLLFPKDLRYDERGDQGEKNNPQPKEKLPKEDALEFFKYVQKHGSPEDRQRIGALAKASLLDLYAQFEASQKAEVPQVPRWKDRKALYPNIKMNPVKWIKKHYGELQPDGKWQRGSLTMADIHNDPLLYGAYRPWIKKHPEDDLELPKQLRRKDPNPSEFLDRHRKTSLASYHKLKRTP